MHESRYNQVRIYTNSNADQYERDTNKGKTWTRNITTSKTLITKIYLKRPV